MPDMPEKYGRAKDGVALDRGDVTLERLEKDLCGDCLGRPPTHAVYLDLRGNGQKNQVSERLCFPCAKEFAQRLKSSLPKAPRRS